MFHFGNILFFRPPPPLPRPLAPALLKRRNKNGLRPVPTTPQPHFLPPWTIFQNKGVLKLLIIIPWRSVELRRLGGGGRPDGGELRHAGVSGVNADCDATAAAAAAAVGKPQDGSATENGSKGRSRRVGRGPDGDVGETVRCLGNGSE